MTRLVRVARVLGPVWAAFAIGMTVAALSDVNDDAKWLVLVAGIVAGSAAVAAGLVAVRHPRLAGALLMVAAVTSPTFAAVWLNVVPLLVGVVLATRAATHRRPSLA